MIKLIDNIRHKSVRKKTASRIAAIQILYLHQFNDQPLFESISTFDKQSSSGMDIKIELRNPDEVKKINKIKVTNAKKVFNPAFDITPGKFITGIITEKGIITNPYKTKIKELLSV